MQHPNKPKILIISAVFPPEPNVSSIISYDLASELAKKIEVNVICPKPSRPKGFNFISETEKYGFNLTRLKSFTCPSSNFIGKLIENFSFGYHCLKFIRKYHEKFNVIYINSWPLFSQYIIIRIAKKYRIPTIIHIQDIYPESLINKLPLGKQMIQKLLMPIDMFVLKNSASIVAISKNMRDTLVKSRNICPDKIIIVPNWQDEIKFLNFSKSKSSTCIQINTSFTFMYLGNNGPLANIEFIIHSFVKAKINNSKLVIAGSGSNTKPCIKLANFYNAKNIEFISVPDGMVPAIQDTADVLLLPLKKNAAMSSIPSKLPAYMFSAKPIIGCLDLESDTAKAIIESKCGMVIEPDNEIELINAMILSANWDKDQRKEMGKLGFNYAIKNFSKQNNLNKIISSIEDVCN